MNREQAQILQNRSLIEAEVRCMRQLEEEPPVEDDGKYCPGIWDDIMCWSTTAGGTVATQPCPEYINNFNQAENAVKECLPNGTWYHRPFSDQPFTDYTKCLPSRPFPTDLVAHMPRIRLMYQIGYGISLTSLCIAVLVMLFCRGLHSKINRLHVNLFVSLTLKAAVTFLKEYLFVQGLGFSIDVTYSSRGVLSFVEEGTHWQCKLLVTVWLYSIATVYTWILVEGIYLANLVHRTLSTDRRGVRFYIIFGWCFPFVYLIPWIFVRIFLDDFFCWTTYRRRIFYWLFNGPIFASVIITFMLFLIIIRALCSRLTMAERHVNQKYRKLAKFTLVLMLLFGVHFTIFLFISDSVDMVVPKLYAEMFSNAFQGFFVSLFFCFLNEEVLLAIRRGWSRFVARQRSQRQLSESHRMHSHRSAETKHILGGKRDRGVQVYSKREADTRMTETQSIASWRGARGGPAEREPPAVAGLQERQDSNTKRKCVFLDKRQVPMNPEVICGHHDRVLSRNPDSTSPESGEQSSRRSSFERGMDSGVHSS